jgi:hypothetical protein
MADGSVFKCVIRSISVAALWRAPPTKIFLEISFGVACGNIPKGSSDRFWLFLTKPNAPVFGIKIIF